MNPIHWIKMWLLRRKSRRFSEARQLAKDLRELLGRDAWIYFKKAVLTPDEFAALRVFSRQARRAFLSKRRRGDA